MTKEIRRLPAPLYQVGKAVRQAGRSPQERAWLDYFIPGTDVLRNELGSAKGSYGTTNAALLTDVEERLSLSRVAAMADDPVPGRFDLDHMKAIHARLFSGVYPWAGQQRTVDMNKLGHEYAPHTSIAQIWAGQFNSLRSRKYLTGITDQALFTDQLAEHWAKTNHAHAFREGNTRSQAVFFSQLASQAGWDLDVSRLSDRHPESVRPEFVQGRFHYQDTGHDHSALTRALAPIISPSPGKALEIEQARQGALRERALRFPELDMPPVPPPPATDHSPEI